MKAQRNYLILMSLIILYIDIIINWQLTDISIINITRSILSIMCIHIRDN